VGSDWAAAVDSGRAVREAVASEVKAMVAAVGVIEEWAALVRAEREEAREAAKAMVVAAAALAAVRAAWAARAAALAVE